MLNTFSIRPFILIFFLFLSVSGCKQKNHDVITIDTKPAVQFIDLLNYLDKKNGSVYLSKRVSDEIITQNYRNNLNDKILNQKIDQLLDLPVYIELSKITTAFTDSTRIHGKDAYKFAFLNLPYRLVAMSGGIDESWVNFQKSGNSRKATIFMDLLVKNSHKIAKKTISLSSKYLPEPLQDTLNIKTVFCIDGNRGSFTIGNVIIMDLLDFNDFDVDIFTRILAHELHHVIYESWLDRYFLNKTSQKNTLFTMQKRILMEGLAQQINYKDYNEQIKKLYANKPLIRELQNAWIDSFLKLSESNNPEISYEKIERKAWEESIPLLKKYVKGKIEPETFPHRPTAEYYLSYHIYHTILQNSGKAVLNDVILHPEKLLQAYNNARDRESVLPAFPGKIVTLWHSILQ